MELWKNRKKIWTGISNYLWKNKKIEKMAKERISICKENKCGSYDTEGRGCYVPGTGPCCDIRTGGCGCSLKFLTRSPESECEKGFWKQKQI